MVHAQESKNAQKIKQKNNFSISIKKKSNYELFFKNVRKGYMEPKY